MRRPNTVVGIEKQTLVTLYLERKLSCIAVGERLNVSKTRVLYWLKRYEIPRRNLSDSHKNQVGWLKDTKGVAKPNSGSFRKGNAPWNKGKSYPLGRKLWLDTREKRLRSLRKRPTSPERKFMELCESLVLPFRYVGNGAFWIANLNPDFIDAETKTVVDILGDYWHSPLFRPQMRIAQDPEYRKKVIESAGWFYVPIWESQLVNEDGLKALERTLRWKSTMEVKN